MVVDPPVPPGIWYSEFVDSISKSPLPDKGWLQPIKKPSFCCAKTTEKKLKQKVVTRTAKINFILFIILF